MKSKLKTEALESLIDNHIGKLGSKRRVAFENELSIDMLGLAIKQTRQKINLTQTQLGALVGLNKTEISKIEKNITQVKFETIVKIFNAMGANVSFKVELFDE